MGVKNLPHLCQELLAHGMQKETPIAIIENGSTASQRTVVGNLTTIAGLAKSANIGSPALIITGSVVTLRNQLNWFASKEITDDSHLGNSFHTTKL